MPELPEAETIARGLHAAIAGSQVDRVRVHRAEVVEPMKPAAFRRALHGQRIEAVGRRGKWIVACLADGARWITQLRMTGRFSWSEGARLRSEPHLSLSLVLRRSGEAGVLRFHDVRRFARTGVLSAGQWSELDQSLGLEPLSPRFTHASLRRLLRASRAPVKNLLLDQARIAGIGNIYASEACWEAQIDPRRAAADLDGVEAGRLRSAIRKVLRQAIRRRGTSFSDYRDILGESGGFQNELRVYGRQGERCCRCGGVIERAVLAGRSTFYCARCQS